MDHVIHHLFSTLEPLISDYGYIFLVIFLFLESIPLIGYLVPGALLLIFVGTLIKIGTFGFFPTIPIAIGAIFAGDLLMFLVGKYYGYEFLHKFGKYFFLSDSRIEKAKEFLHTHRIKAIVFNKFNGLARPLNGFISGAAHLSVPFFIITDFIVVSVWATLHITVGYVFGEGLIAISKYVSRIFILVVIIAIIIAYTYRAISRHHTIFRKYHLYTLFLNISSLLIFGLSIDSVVHHHWFRNIDRLVNISAFHIHYNWLTNIMLAIRDLSSLYIIIPIAVVLLGFLIYKKEKYAFLVSIFSIILGFLVEYRTRFDRNIFSAFPNEHLPVITIVISLLIWIFTSKIKSKNERIIIRILGAIIIFFICFSIVYLHLHTLSEVIGGASLGIFVVSLFMLIFRAIIWGNKYLLLK